MAGGDDAVELAKREPLELARVPAGPARASSQASSSWSRTMPKACAPHCATSAGRVGAARARWFRTVFVGYFKARARVLAWPGAAPTTATARGAVGRAESGDGRAAPRAWRTSAIAGANMLRSLQTPQFPALGRLRTQSISARHKQPELIVRNNDTSHHVRYDIALGTRSRTRARRAPSKLQEELLD
jgi:hypothetical protein